MNSSAFNKNLRKVRIALAKMPWKKILTFSFFVFLSTIFWFLQVYDKNFFGTYRVPIKYTAIPDSIVFDEDLPQYLELTVEDRGYSILRYYFTPKRDSLEINVKDIISEYSNNLLSDTELNQYIKYKLYPSSTILSLEPSQISFHHTTLQEKKIPVIFDGQIFLETGYLLDGDIQTTPDSVTAYGGKDVLSNLNYAYTTSDTIYNLKASSVLDFELKKIHNVKFSPSKVQVSVPVDRYTQKDVIVPINSINLPDNLTVKLFPSSVKISFLVSLSKYQTINQNDFLIQLDYQDIKDIKESIVPIRIMSSPDYVHNITLSPSEVEFIFEQK